MILTTLTLKDMQCSTPGCTTEHGAIYFHGKCHPESPSWTWYENGVITVECATCRKTIVKVQVA